MLDIRPFDLHHPTHTPPPKTLWSLQMRTQHRTSRVAQAARKHDCTPWPILHTKLALGGADGSHQVQGSVDLQGLLQGAPGDLHERDPAGRVPSVADLVAVMRDGLAESRHDGSRAEGKRGVRRSSGRSGAPGSRASAQPQPARPARRLRCRKEGKGHASRVTLGQSPRMLSPRRIAARGGGARTEEAGRGGACARPEPGAAGGAEGVRAWLGDAPVSPPPMSAPSWRASPAAGTQW